MRRKTQAVVTLGAIALAVSATALAADKLPDQTEDGLTRIDTKHVDVVYWREGASLEAYTKVMLGDCTVAFRKNWQRDQNRNRRDLSGRVRPSDMDRIKSSLSAAFNEEFTKVLEKGGYEIVQNSGEDVLLLRPSIIDLDVTAPDLKTSGINRTFTASAGKMTLYMELYDSATGAKIGQVIDKQQARDNGHMSFSNSVTNRSEANKILGKWANLLVKSLDEASGKD